MNLLENARAEKALKWDVLVPDCEAAVIAVQKDNGQVIVHNIGDTDGRDAIYRAVGMANQRKLSDMNCRLVLSGNWEKGGEE